MSDLVSVIIPVYNDHLNISNSINSILDQDYQNFEIIIIDDFSNKKTKNVISTFTNHPKIQIYRNQKNLGVFESRIIGIKNSIGKFIAFLDSDDTYSRKFLSTMMYSIKQSKSDVSICGVNLIKNLPWKFGKTINKNCTISNNNIFQLYVLNKLGPPVLWNKLFKKSLFSQIMSFRPLFKISTGEDNLMNFVVFSKAKKIIISKKKLYNHNYNSKSITSNQSDYVSYSSILKNLVNALNLFSKANMNIKNLICFNYYLQLKPSYVSNILFDKLFSNRLELEQILISLIKIYPFSIIILINKNLYLDSYLQEIVRLFISKNKIKSFYNLNKPNKDHSEKK